MKKRYWILIAIVIVGAVLFGLGKFKSGDQTTEVTVENTGRGDITATVTATGKVYPEIEVTISSEVAGEIVELPVHDGAAVEKGDVLVRVNPDTLEAQVLQQEAALRATNANSLEAQARMMQAELELKRIRSLSEKGFTTQEQVDQSDTDYQIAQASYQATLSRIEQQEMQLQEARNSLAKATSFSPIAGTVTSLTSELGDRVVGTGQFEGTEIMRVADLSQIEVRVEVSESDIVQVKIGDLADVEVDALPGEEFQGKVSEIANSAIREDNSSSDQLTTFLVKVRLLEPSPKIRPGMTATAEIKTETVTDVVKVPLQAVTVRTRDVVAKQLAETKDGPSAGENDQAEGSERSGPPSNGEGRGNGGGGSRKRDTLERVVFLFENGTAKLVRVETGLADNRHIEIKSGVSEGDEIITGGYRVLTRELENGKVVQKAAGMPGFNPGASK